MKAPEYLLSTPRLILLILTIGLIVFTNNWVTEPNIFKDITLIVFWYFFGSRGSEVPNKNRNEPEIKKDNDSKPISEDNLHDINNIPDVG